jgi:hypothetical protein
MASPDSSQYSAEGIPSKVSGAWVFRETLGTHKVYLSACWRSNSAMSLLA